ncbi:MAG TPA: S41 family peptidase [Terracidiphilus sp.]|nr:S41 family peptidase [Terracidiphilus sp.]
MERHRKLILDAIVPEVFEKAVAMMLAEVSPSPLALLSDRTLIAPPSAINASFAVRTIEDQPYWAFKDVLPGGVADRAGIKAGDVLLSIGGEPVIPSLSDGLSPHFEMQQHIPIRILRGSRQEEVDLIFKTGTPKYKDNPYSEPVALTTGSRTGNIAYLRVSLFPGAIGIDFANELDAIFSGRFKNADRLIVDMRGNPGGGIGALALMSYLTADRRPVGYSKSRAMARKELPPDRLPIFDRIPRSKLVLPMLVLKYLGKTSIFLYTEALGHRPWHGRTVLLVDEHTAGAAEMVAQFAQENRLATIAGMKTPGRLVTRRASRLGYGYQLVIPIAAYVSAQGARIEGMGITPDVSLPWSFADADAGKDAQLEGAVELLHASG